MANIVATSTGIRKADRAIREVADPSQSDFLGTAMRQFKGVDEDESELREDMIDDLEFRFNIDNAQWDQADLRIRKADNKPTVTINRIPQFIRQVTNQMRSARMAIQVNPTDSAGDVSTAEALQGIIRNIENNSDADISYATGGEHQCTMGRGYWRLLTEWMEEDGFEQSIRIGDIQNPFSVFIDSSHQRVTAQDARFGFILDRVPKDDYVDLYGETSRSMYDTFNTRGNRSRVFSSGTEGYLVAEYFYRVFTEDTVIELILEDGSMVVVSESDLPKPMPEQWKTRNKRKVRRAQCKWAKITPVEVLDGNEARTEGRDFPSQYIPIVQVLGDMYNVDGRRDLRGMVRDAKSPQKMYNYWASALTEMIGLSPRAPYIGYEGQFKGHEAKWNQANKKNYAYLEVAALTIGGQPAPLPQRQQYEPAIQSLIAAFQLADNDMKAVMGLYDASLGEQGPEQSGKAILARQRQGEMGNSNYLDNMSRAIRYTGKILLDMIPRVYTPQRVLRILGADNQQESIIIHTGAPAKDLDALQSATGIAKVYDISVGRYDVSITTGPNFASRRQEAVTALLELLDKSKDPRMAQAVADILVRNMDWPGAQEIAARLKRMVPKELLGPNEGGGGPQIPPELKEKLQEMEQELTELRSEAKTKMAEIQSKHQLTMAKAQSATQQAQAKAQTQVQIAALRAQTDQRMSDMQARFEMALQQSQQRFELVQQEDEQEHERELAGREHQQQLEAAQLAAKTKKQTTQIAADATVKAAKTSAKAKKATAAKPAKSSGARKDK